MRRLFTRVLTPQSREDLADAVEYENPTAISNAIRYWGTKEAIVSAVLTDSRNKVRCRHFTVIAHEERG
jgi:hypothetical protein